MFDSFKLEDGSVEYVVIELNGSACGFQSSSWREDSVTLAREAFARLSKLLDPKARKLQQLHAMKMNK